MKRKNSLTRSPSTSIALTNRPIWENIFPVKKKSEAKPLGEWVEARPEYDDDRRMIWTCPFCGQHEYSSYRIAADGSKIFDRWEMTECYHCHKDADGNVYWSLYRTGSWGYYGDGDFEWDGGWEGKKLVLTHRPHAGLIKETYSTQQTSSYGAPNIVLKVTAWSEGRYTGERRNRRVSAFSAYLQFESDGWGRVCVVEPKKVRSLAQVRREVDALDLSAGIAQMLKEYYSKDSITCVWKRENDQWVPFASYFIQYPTNELDVGVWATQHTRDKRPGMIKVSYYGSSGLYGPDVVEDKPTPWVSNEVPTSDVVVSDVDQARGAQEKAGGAEGPRQESTT